jgi:hypothetical protein
LLLLQLLPSQNQQQQLAVVRQQQGRQLLLKHTMQQQLAVVMHQLQCQLLHKQHTMPRMLRCKGRWELQWVAVWLHAVQCTCQLGLMVQSSLYTSLLCL